MLYLILSIICSVSVGAIFKVTRRYEVSISQIISWNYVFALILCYLFFDPEVSKIDASAPWEIYIPLALLLPSIFLMLAASVNHIGIVKTDAAQRLSLFIPILAAWLMFGENFHVFKIIGISIGFPAIALIFSKKDDVKDMQWHYPLMVLLGFGLVDILFKHIALLTKLSYTTSLFVVFCGALIVATCIALFEAVAEKRKFNIMSLAFGVLVGIFNFGNILFYLLAHKEFSNNPSTVFAIMNIGVIVVGSLIGILVFKEKMTKLNYAGLLMAVSAIIFITLSQVYKI
jgi:drug/metabolite transporter (DMT)-like permease